MKTRQQWKDSKWKHNRHKDLVIRRWLSEHNCSRKALSRSMIDRVCFRMGDSIYALPRPYRHHHVVQTVNSLLPEKVKAIQQGFMNSDGWFLDRVTARQVTHLNKQKLGKDGYTHWFRLFSECIWDTPGDWTKPIGTPERTAYEEREDRSLAISRLMIFTIKDKRHVPIRRQDILP